MGADVGLDGRVVVVTGAGRGLGRSHALLLSARGARVVVNDVGAALDGRGTSPEPADQVVEEIRAAGGEAVADHHDVATAHGAAALVAAAMDAFGSLDVLVANAGILRSCPFEDLELASWEAVLGVHLGATFHVLKEALPHLKAATRGRVVLTVSQAGFFGHPGSASYAAAKMGVVGLMRVVALEGAAEGVAVNAIAPYAATRMTDGRLGEGVVGPPASEASAVVAWLAHGDCALNGEILAIRDGRVARVLIAVTAGTRAEALTPEFVRDHIEQIMDPGVYVVPRLGERG